MLHPDLHKTAQAHGWKLTYRGHTNWYLVGVRKDGLLNLRRPGDHTATVADPCEVRTIG